MWFLPSRGRPHLISRVFKNIPTEPGILAVDDDQAELYQAVDLPPKWKLVVLPRMALSEKLNALFYQNHDAPYYGIICDDMVAETPNWDRLLELAAGAWHIAYADDCLHRRIGAAAFGGDLIRTIGWLVCPTIKHFFLDDVHEVIANEFKIGRQNSHVKIPHLHFTTGKTPIDQTYRERPDHETDRQAFVKWKADEWPQLRAKLKQQFAAC